MRILLTANASYIPPRGGATRSNLVWLDHLAGAGHACRIVCAALGEAAGRRRQLADEGMVDGSAEDGVEHGRRGAIDVHSTADPARRLRLLREHIAAFQPDWVLVSSEDLGHALLREAHHCAPGRVVYIAHTPQFFPFGRESWNPDPQAAALVVASAGIVAIGQAMADYIESGVGARPAIVHPPIYGSGPFPLHANFDRGLVTMINPCAVKGAPVFLALADAFPAVAFGALPGWGTTAADRDALADRANIEILPNCRDIDDVLARTRVLLMPSVWFEGFGLIVMEAMLRGIPVIASDSGGLREAKHGTGFVIPVGPVERYELVFDERAMPRPVTRPALIEPWCEALRTLLTNRSVYEEESARSRAVALRFVGGLRADGLERYLAGLQPRLSTPAPAPARMESLTPAQRALLLERLRRKKQEAGS